MANLLSPDESLESYFDELFSMDDEVGETESQTSEDLKTPFKSVTAKPAEFPEKALTNIQTPARAPQTKPVDTLPAFAEPLDEQREKLQKLLQTTAPKTQTETIVKTATQVETLQKTEVVPEVKIAVPTIAPVVKAPIVEPVVEQETQEQVHLAMDPSAAEWMANGRPIWAQSRFDVLLFQVSGLTLAVPLVSLGQIQKITDELTPLFGQADWFMGILPTPVGKIRIVNTAKFVMPERYDENFPKNAKLVVSINGVPWGLAVDSVNQPITIEPEQVKWRGDRSKRPWLAGTVKDHMCALLDIPTIGLLLQSADKNSSKTYG